MEVNGSLKAGDSKIIMVNSCGAFGCTNRSGGGVCFHKIPCDKERHKLWLIALKLARPPYLKHDRVCCGHFLEGDYYPNYKMHEKSVHRALDHLAIEVA